ncbi:MAG: MG2 domain-containing protein, partial [Casimicrobiaceae bacterium]
MKIPRLPALACLLLLLTAALPAAAQDEATGAPFFLLSDAAYGSDDVAMVRLEAQNMGAVAEYGGADIYVYRVRQPLEFLKRQKNLHRIDTAGDYAGPGLSNALARIWDNWWTGSRSAWRELFSANAREAVTAQAPETRSHPLAQASTPEQLHPPYRPLSGHTLVASFRYPVHKAKPIQPPAGVKLAGSSSDFMPSPEGNVLIPLGRREPGLYLVEAMVGDHRAVTLVFVSNSIAVTKVSAGQMLVWVADRRDGNPVRGAKTVWSDGVGVLATGGTDARGVVTFQRSAPEKTYVFGEDPQGGAYVAENYYYDSEIFNTKLYAVTDRPLYRPGETVFVKFVGRTFRSARESTPVEAGDLKLQVFDANGFPVAGQTLRMTPSTGGDTSFQLPDNAVAGGYELRFVFKGDAYGAAFRVAEYQKPHFEINVLADQRDFKTNEDVKGRLQLVYPDGKPVANARADLSVRAQRLTMIEGDLGYTGQFPVQLTTASLVTDGSGMASFVLPPAKEPSRYVLSVLATDGAAYRVRATKEILIERGAGTYAITGERAFSAAGDDVVFGIKLLAEARPGIAPAPPVRWDWVRLENRKRDSGALANGGRFALAFAEPGTYTVSVHDAAGNIVGATSHYVSGGGVSAPQGSIEIVFEKTTYKPGETAAALITFPQKVDQALFTLERDRVEKTALMASASGWVRATRVSPTQWRTEIPVREDYGPNITFSVVYVKGGDYVFQNLGLKVEQPRIEVAVRPDKAVYAPGDKVTLELTALIGGKPAPGAQLTIGVVDEMIYVLQPEIAPDIFDFFYHPRRNNVRTSASLAFIGYDLAKPPGKQAIPTRRQTHERTIKILERPRREDKDTAYWQPTLAVDANGHASVSFLMPDSLTRWRVTVRAASASGTVGQSVAHVRSDKEFYVKWTSPAWMRDKDAPNASVAIFNQRNTDVSVELAASGSGANRRETLTVKPGANFVSLPLHATGNDARVDLVLSLGGKPVDALAVPLKVVPTHWETQRSLAAAVTGRDTALALPSDASNVRVQFADSAATQFRRLMDDLIDYPYGCVEQTSSRLIPYSLALQSALPGEARLTEQLTQRLHSYRFRLAQMAGPQATFGWWSPPDRDGDALLTAYAYYADWHASRALKLTLPPGHFDRLLDVYRKNGVQRSTWHRALILYWMQEMGLPVRSLAEALAEELVRAPTANPSPKSSPPSPLTSMVFAQEEGDTQTAMTKLLAAYVVRQAQGNVPPALEPALDAAAEQLRKAGLPLGEALLLMTGRRPAKDAAGVLEQVRAETPTIDRSLTLLWTYRALGGASTKAADDVLRAAVSR